MGELLFHLIEPFPIMKDYFIFFVMFELPLPSFIVPRSAAPNLIQQQTQAKRRQLLLSLQYLRPTVRPLYQLSH